uniref:EF-hand domain-containing protein n=1 Tax=Psilocybe cubensis TaxID=181762 RepID=A0A8H7XPP8_PSICU
MTGSDFERLPGHIQRAIDNAFNKAINPNNSSKFLPISNTASSNPVSTSLGNDDGGGGGFLVDDNEDVPEDIDVEPSTSNSSDDLIPLDLIPTALQFLDLPPDDEEILGVLRNAASGWSSSSSLQTPKPLDPQTRFVSREDWRSVCAVLLENRESDDDDDLSENAQQRDEDEDGDTFMDDDFENSVSSGGGGDSDEEYQGERRRSTRTRRSKTSQQRTDGLSPEHSEAPKKLTKRQYQTCLATYALFFPDIPNEELLKKRILVSDLQRVSNLLGEKTKAEEMVEMLEMFSTSKDKAMSFDDFTRMMITAKLA